MLDGHEGTCAGEVDEQHRADERGRLTSSALEFWGSQCEVSERKDARNLRCWGGGGRGSSTGSRVRTSRPQKSSATRSSTGSDRVDRKHKELEDSPLVPEEIPLEVLVRYQCTPEPEGRPQV